MIAFDVVQYRYLREADLLLLLFILMGSANGIVAIKFGGLRRWTYPIVRILVGTWWGWNWALVVGLRKKIHDPEVRALFGLPPRSIE